MGRPRIDSEARAVRSHLPPPADLARAQRKRWESELAHFPPAYFTPADTPALLHYLVVLEEFDRVLAAHRRARGAEKNVTAKELRAVSKTLTVLQRALRMFPTGRASRALAGNLANDPGEAVLARCRPGEEPWECIFRESADASKRN